MATRALLSTGAVGRDHLLDEPAGGMSGYPPWRVWRTKRRLIKDPVFDVTAPHPLTVVTLGAEMLGGASAPGPLILEAHGPAGLQLEHLRVGNNDWVDVEYSSKWPHRVYVDSPEGVYTERFCVDLIWGLSTPSLTPLLVFS
jgi:hypothetical protein